MRVTSVQSVVGEDWPGICHVNVDCDTNQASTYLKDRKEIEMYDAKPLNATSVIPL